MNKLYLFTFLLFFSFSTFAQNWQLKLSSNVYLRTWDLTTKAEKKETLIGGALVTLYQNGKQVAQTTSGSNGEFSINVPPNGDYYLTVSYSGCNTKRMGVNTQYVPDNISNSNFMPTFKITGGFIMVKPYPGINYSELNQDLIRVEFISSKKAFDDTDSGTEKGLGIVSKIYSAEDDLFKRFCATNKEGDDALAKPNCPLAKQLYEKAIAMISGEQYPVVQLAKVGLCLKDKEEAEKKAITEKANKEKAALEKAEADKLAKEKANAEKAEKDKQAAEKLEAEKLAKEKAALEKAEADKLAKEKANAEKSEKDKQAAEKLEADKLAKEKAVAEKAEADRLAKEKAITEKAEKEKQAAEKLAADKLAKDKAAIEKAEADKIAKEKANTEKSEKDKQVAEKLAADKLAKDKAAIEKAEADKLAKEKANTEKAEKDKQAAEKLEADKLANEKAQADKLAKQKNKEEKAQKQKEALEKIKQEELAEDIAKDKKRAAEEEERKKLEYENKKKESEANTGHGNAKYSIPQKLGVNMYKEYITLGDDKFKFKQYKDAKGYYEEALKQKPNDVYSTNKIAECDKNLIPK